MNKFCQNCGHTLQEGQDVCLNCGLVVNKTNTTNINTKTTNGLAIAGFTLSIIGLILSIFIIGIFLCIIGLVLSIIGLIKSKSINGGGKGFAIAGIVINVVVIVIFTFIIIFASSTWSIIKSTTHEQTCNTYGDNYTAVEGRDVYGSNKKDDWYCCKTGELHTTSSCFLSE